MHAKAGDRLDHVVGLLAIRKHPEDRAHRADVLHIGAEEHQVAGDTEELAQHYAHDLDPFRHLNAKHVLEVHDVGQFVHHPAEIVHPVGIGDVGMPGLALGHLLGAAMVIADIRHRADDFLAVELQHDTEYAMHRRMVRAHVKEHELGIAGLALHAPVFGLELQGVLFLVLALRVQVQRFELGRAGGVILAQRVALPGRRHENAAQVRVPVEGDPEHVPYFALVPVGVGPYAGGGGRAQIVVEQRDLEADLGNRRQAEQVIDHGEIRGRLVEPVLTYALVDRGQVEQHPVGGGAVLAQELEHVADPVAADPQGGHAIGGDLLGERTLVKAFEQLLFDIDAIEHQTESGVRRVVTDRRSLRLRSRIDSFGRWVTPCGPIIHDSGRFSAPMFS